MLHVRKIAAALAVAMLAILGSLAPAGAERAVIPTAWNKSSDPVAIYGFCRPEGSGFSIRSALIRPEGETLSDVLAITILRCAPFTGAGGSRKVPRPSGSPYAYCVRNHNDGIGNFVEIGVTKIGALINPYQPHSGCPAGVPARPKLELVIAAGQDPRLVSGVVTLSCQAAPGAPGVRVVACPAGPHPYAYCLRTANDGNGTAVTLGVVAANGLGDPYGLYGECGVAGEGVAQGFQRKSSIVAAAGRATDNLAAIHLPACTNAGGVAAPLGVVLCTTPGFDRLGLRFDHCIQGRDRLGNFVRAGVLTRS